MIDADTAHEFAVSLRDAEQEGTSVPLASTTLSDLNWAGARRIALARDELRRTSGDVLIGYKLGWTSAAMRGALGIDQPNWGTLWRSQQIGARLPLGTMRHAKAEPEIVFVAGAELRGADVDAEKVLATAAGWALGIEVVHPRWESYDFTWLDNTADNSSAGAVAGGAVGSPDINPHEVEVVFSNGAQTRRGSGDQAMGSPAEAVAWLARALAEEDRSIAAGQIVFTGGLTAPFSVVQGARFSLRSDHLAPVAFTVA